MNKRQSKFKRIVNQAEIARRMGVSPVYVRMLLSGKRKNIERLAQIREIIAKELSMANGP